MDNYDPLYRAARRGDLDAVKKFIDEHPPALKATINPDKYYYSLLQVSVLAGHVHIVEELVRLISEQDLAIKRSGFTHLAFAAIFGNKEMAEAMVKKNTEILGISTEDGSIPVSLAFCYGRKEMARYLYGVTPNDVLISGEGKAAAAIIPQAICFQKDYATMTLHGFLTLVLYIISLMIIPIFAIQLPILVPMESL